MTAASILKRFVCLHSVARLAVVNGDRVLYVVVQTFG
jgi:hypothetical protein